MHLHVHIYYTPHICMYTCTHTSHTTFTHNTCNPQHTCTHCTPTPYNYSTRTPCNLYISSHTRTYIRGAEMMPGIIWEYFGYAGFENILRIILRKLPKNYAGAVIHIWLLPNQPAVLLAAAAWVTVWERERCIFVFFFLLFATWSTQSAPEVTAFQKEGYQDYK